MDHLFLDDYHSARQRFRLAFQLVLSKWPSAELKSQPIDSQNGSNDQTIDWIEAGALEDPARLLVITTGEHGIESTVGVAMLHLLMLEFLSRLNPKNTGLLLVHIINPWGMAHNRRTNPHNVDLNRNFVVHPDELNPTANPAYTRLDPFLNPKGRVNGIRRNQAGFLLSLASHISGLGINRFREATLLGQYRYPQGIYYGGATLQEETQLMMRLYRAGFSKYPQILHLDMHTGYGPRYQMSVVNSYLEKASSTSLSQRFAYPLVVKADPQEFYSIRGDMIDYVYTLAHNEFPDRRFYAASFEFGTLGDSLQAGIRSLRASILENQAYWYGAANESIRGRITASYSELFAPQEERWRTKAIADARQAFEGILRAEGLITPSKIPILAYS